MPDGVDPASARMDLRQLRYFVAIVEHGSVSKAAAALNVAQPALSQHVRHMEAELAVDLLHRGPRGVVPTEAGARLAVHARALLERFAEIPDSVRGTGRPLTGTVRIGLPGTVSEILSVPLIEAANARYPGIRLRVAEAMSGFIRDWLLRDAVDLALLYNPVAPKGLVLHHGLTEALCLFAAPGTAEAAGLEPGPVALARAAELDLVLPGPGHGLRDLIAEAAPAGVVIAPRIEIDAYARIKELVARGLGFGILPRMAVQEAVAAGRFREWPLVDPPLDRRVFLAYAADRPLPAAGAAIAQLAWGLLADLVRAGRWSAELSAAARSPLPLR